MASFKGSFFFTRRWPLNVPLTTVGSLDTLMHKKKIFFRCTLVTNRDKIAHKRFKNVLFLYTRYRTGKKYTFN